MKRLLIILLTILALDARADYDAEAIERKADYFFLEGMRQRALGEEALSTALMQRAFDLSANGNGREAFEAGSHQLMYGNINRDSLQTARALQICEDYFNANPTDIYAGSYLANYLAENGNISRAAQIYETLERSKPDNTAIIGGHADLLMQLGRYDDAITLFRQLERSMGRNTALTRRIVSGMVMQGDTVGALNEIDSLIAALPRSVEALHEGAFLATALDNPLRGLEYIEKAQALDPSNGLTYYHAANIYKRLGRDDDYNEAIRGAIIGDDLDLEPKIELLRYYIGEELGENGEGVDRIEPLFDSLVNQYTHEPKLRALYASFLVSLKRFTDAAEQMEQVVALDPTEPGNFEFLARLYGSAEDYNSLVATTRKAISLYPDEISFYEMQAGAQSQLSLYPSAIVTLQNALTIDKLTPQMRSTLLRDIADIAQNDPTIPADTVVANYEAALLLDPENDLAMNNYAYWLSENSGDLVRAKELIAKAVVFDPGSPTYYDTYAWVCFRLGDLENAKRYIDMALLFDKSEQEGSPEQLAELLGHAADIYERLGQLDKASEFRNRANQLTSSSAQE